MQAFSSCYLCSCLLFYLNQAMKPYGNIVASAFLHVLVYSSRPTNGYARWVKIIRTLHGWTAQHRMSKCLLEMCSVPVSSGREPCANDTFDGCGIRFTSSSTPISQNWLTGSRSTLELTHFKCSIKFSSSNHRNRRKHSATMMMVIGTTIR